MEIHIANKGGIVTDTIETQKIIKEFFPPILNKGVLKTYIPINWKKFFNTCDLPKLNKEDIENLNEP